MIFSNIGKTTWITVIGGAPLLPPNNNVDWQSWQLGDKNGAPPTKRPIDIQFFTHYLGLRKYTKMNNIIRFIGILLVMIFFDFGLVACSSDDEEGNEGKSTESENIPETVMGSWCNYADIEGNYIYFVFSSEEYRKYYVYHGKTSIQEEGTYKYSSSDGKLILRSSTGTEKVFHAYNYQYSEDKKTKEIAELLTLAGKENGEYVIFQLSSMLYSNAHMYDTRNQYSDMLGLTFPTIVGVWVHALSYKNDKYMWYFYKDGSGVYRVYYKGWNEKTFTYTYDGQNKLNVQFTNASKVTEYNVSLGNGDLYIMYSGEEPNADNLFHRQFESVFSK